MEERIERYWKARQRGLDWLLRQMNADGTMNPITRGPLPFYKVPRAMLASGRIREADSLLEWVRQESLTPEGDFRGPRLEFHARHYAYSNAWLVWAAQLMGRFDISYPGKSFLFRFVNQQTGGSYSNPPSFPESNCEQDLLSTSFNALLGLYFGEVEVAEKAATFLQSFLDQQPNLAEEMWLRTDGDGKLIDGIPEGCEEPRFYLLRNDKPSQYYYFVGAPTFFLCKLYRMTRNRRHLSTAKAYFEFADSCGGYAYADLFTAKVGLAAASLFQATGEERYRKAALRSFDRVISLQTPKGCWMKGEEPWVSITAELCVWLPEAVIYLSL